MVRVCVLCSVPALLARLETFGQGIEATGLLDHIFSACYIAAIILIYSIVHLLTLLPLELHAAASIWVMISLAGFGNPA